MPAERTRAKLVQEQRRHQPVSGSKEIPVQIQDEEQVQEVENGARPGDLLERLARGRELQALYAAA